jgi:monofunctional biosynthetic peptidoglycan transglycosylase
MKRLLYKSLLISFVLGLTAYGYWRLPNVSALKTMNPKHTVLMKLRDQEYRDKGLGLERQQIWVPYPAVAEHLKKAVLISEDASFFNHNGIDFFEMKEAIKDDLEEMKFKRGGSTITMQLARNLYLNPSKNPLRKLKELIITLQLEYFLSKERIFELYLNVVEWGSNIYGAEAAARHYFAKPASDLDELEAAALAALLPSPRNPQEKELRYRRNLVLKRMVKIGYIGEAEYARGKQAPLFHKVID